MKKNLLSIVFVSALLSTSCQFTLSYDSENGFHIGQNDENNQNNNNNSDIPSDQEQEKTFLPMETIQGIYKDFDVEVPTPDYVPSNKNAYWTIRDEGYGLSFSIYGSNENEASAYQELIMQKGWYVAGAGYYKYPNCDACIEIEVNNWYVFLLFGIDKPHPQNNNVELWTSFGGKYTSYLEEILGCIYSELGFAIDHTANGSYENNFVEMLNALNNMEYPDISTGNPNQFVYYHALKILKPLDDLISSISSDYYENYMHENYFYDRDASRHLYGVPLSRTTEVLGYNGVFVDFCVEKFNDPSLKIIPTTWDEWKTGEKVQKYKEALQELVNYRDGCWYAFQDEDGTAHDFEKSATNVEGKVQVFDYRSITSSQVSLMSWESLDNMFITLLKQWGAEYTILPQDQLSVTPRLRKGKILFVNYENLDKTVSMLRYFNEMQKDGIITVPQMINESYSASAFRSNKVMFMVTSSGLLGFYGSNLSQGLRVSTIPYKDEDKKYVISEGANLCLTDRSEDPTKAISVIKELTTGKFQTEWALKTGYFPVSKSALNSEEYQYFLNDYSTDDKEVVCLREGAKVNYQHYMNLSENWCQYVEDAFIGSDVIRNVMKNLIPNVFKNLAYDAPDSAFFEQINIVLNNDELKNNPNIDIDRY